MKIGNIEIKGYAALSPMAGVADRAMREICVNHGAGFCVGELTSAKGISLGDKKSKALISADENGVPYAPQLFGCEPSSMADAAKFAEAQGNDFIDINMGCPAPKVAGNGGGSALLKDPLLAGEIVSAVSNAVKIPVTVKIRIGWDKGSINAVEIAKICESAGAKAITVHGRTREQMYAPSVNLEAIKQVKQNVKIPVIANGDITDGKSAENTYKITGCDYVSVGRAARGNPFIFDEINAYLDGKPYTPPTLEEKLFECIKQIKLMKEYKDPHTAILEARKHTAWYLSGIDGAAALRRECGEINSLEDVYKICEKAVNKAKK